MKLPHRAQAVVVALALAHPLSALPQDQAPSPESEAKMEALEIVAPKFPGGVSPSMVFARLDWTSRALDFLLVERGIEAPDAPPFSENGLGPLHVYQMVLSNAAPYDQLAKDLGVGPLPAVTVRPMKYAPRDVLYIADMQADLLRTIAQEFAIELAIEERAFESKSPNDVFRLSIDVYLKVNALGGTKATPSTVFAEMVRATDDVRALLKFRDPACRYRVDSPARVGGKSPGDVYELCLGVRQQINVIREARGQKELPVPQVEDERAILPIEPFIQAQIIVAEMNQLKFYEGMTHSTPLAVPVTQKDPSDVYEQANLMAYLLAQVDSTK